MSEVQTKVELHPDLAKYLVRKGDIQQITHPLFCSLLYTPELNGVYNETYLSTLDAVEKAKKSFSWERFVMLHERSHRFDALDAIQKNLTDPEYWRLLGIVYTDCDNLWQYGQLVPTLFGSPRSHREWMMNGEELNLYLSLPDEIVIYRGHQETNKRGWSWSLNYLNARDVSPKVVRAKVYKKDLISVFTRRKQIECVVDPKNIRALRSFDPENWQNSYMLSQTIHSKSKTITLHGPAHCLKVDWNVQHLCKKVAGADETVCRWFAYLHDCSRMVEGVDSDHGARAAAYANELYASGDLKGIDEKQLPKLITALTDHEKGTTSDDPTIGVCWDADRLDISRVGIIPEEKFFSTEAAKAMIWRI